MSTTGLTSSSLTSPVSTSMVAELTLTWINDRLRAELELRALEEAITTATQNFWKVQASRLLSLSIGGCCWIGMQFLLA